MKKRNVAGDGTVTNCYATGSANGAATAGFAGYIDPHAEVAICYAAANYAKEFAQNGSAANCYIDSDLADIATVASESRTTSEMMQGQTYAGWDFDTIWIIEEGVSYPALRGVASD